MGQSLTDVAPYINDARALQLVLLGGRTGAEVEGHDWEAVRRVSTAGCEMVGRVDYFGRNSIATATLSIDFVVSGRYVK